jgi:hypothetical protein
MSSQISDDANLTIKIKIYEPNDVWTKVDGQDWNWKFILSGGAGSNLLFCHTFRV